nr:hypothetical protein [uncultured Faecalimonas sp.]
MNVLEFLADVDIIEGETDETVESMTCIDRKHNFQFLFVIKREDKYYFQYISFCSLTPDVYNEKFELLRNIFYQRSDEEVCMAVKLLMNTELLNFQKVEEPLMRNPFYSVRGTCHKQCLLSSGFGKENWCKEKAVGYTGTGYRYPDIMEILGDVLEWYCTCPDLDVVFIMHDYYPDDMAHLNFEYAFHVKDKVIKMTDSYEAEKLYKEYHKKYPIDLKGAEEWIAYMKN